MGKRHFPHEERRRWPRVGNILPFLAVFALAFLGHVDCFSPVAAASSLEEHADEYKKLNKSLDNLAEHVFVAFILWPH